MAANWGPNQLIVHERPHQTNNASAAVATDNNNHQHSSNNIIIHTGGSGGGGAPPIRSGADAHRKDGGALVLAAEVPRTELKPQRQPSMFTKIVGGLSGNGNDPTYGDTSTTFWMPDSNKGEIGLIEALFRRRSLDAFVTDDDFLLVSSRPDEELSRNFSNHRNARVDLSLDDFKFSKTAITLRRLNSVQNHGSGGSITDEQLRHGMNANLPLLTRDDYYLVQYRDYSPYAVSKLPSEARRETMFSSKFVERYFAIRVGSKEGVLIPLSQAQFMRGWEMIQASNMRAGGAPKEECGPDGVKRSLSSDQFKALGPPPTDLYGLSAAAQKQQQQAGGNNAGNNNDDDSVLQLPDPHPWDFTPSAMSIRYKKWLHRKYLSVGRIVIRVAFVVGVVLAARYCFAQSAYFAGIASPPPPPIRRARGGRQSQKIEGAFESMWAMGPRAVFDMMFGEAEPVSYRR